MPHRDERKPPPGAARRRPSAVASQPPHDPPSQNGSIRPKRPIHTSLLGTLRTDTPTFVIFLIGFVAIFAVLTFLTVLMLAPFAQALSSQMLG